MSKPRKPQNNPIQFSLLAALDNSRASMLIASGMAESQCAKCGRGIRVLKTHRLESDQAALARVGSLCDGCNGSSADLAHWRD